MIRWAAGLFEGEGTAYLPKGPKGGYPKLQIKMTDLDVLQQFRAVVGVGTINGPYTNRTQLRTNGQTRKPYWQWQAGQREALRLIPRLLPYLGVRRTEQIKAAFSL